MAKPINSYTHPLNLDQVNELREILEHENFEFKTKEYTIFSANKDHLNISVYQKGPKVLIQGKKTEEFVRFTLEPRILGEAKLGYEEELNPEMFEPHFGIDESGKGDFFGPLVIAGAYTDKNLTRSLLDEGIADSKKITDTKIKKLSKIIHDSPGIEHEIIIIGPKKYNELYSKIGNLNKLLAWGHATCIERLCEKRPDCNRALSDQFARSSVLTSSLGERGKNIKIQQRTKAESDIAVATASILARDAFVTWIDKATEQFGFTIPKGASNKVKETGEKLVAQHGTQILQEVSKIHFKTAQNWL
ncbi:ribonuclease HIII [Verrucomicrobiales bacterium]|nr:ribonuclease HIII [Verrucomicrobiales bacterium]MDB4783283.1 ribonuclease HIII [Verrucomicrobiales bacterium]MDC0048411.1 ribonuclease HIII [Verrucomicrobiota bacterium]